MKVSCDGAALKVSGAARGTVGYLVQADRDLEFSGKSRFMVNIAGINSQTDTFDMAKLFKLELDGKAAFDISALQEIRKIGSFSQNSVNANLRFDGKSFRKSSPKPAFPPNLRLLSQN
jgi:hypothetical protein